MEFPIYSTCLLIQEWLDLDSYGNEIARLERGPRANSAWKFDNREAYKIELPEASAGVELMAYHFGSFQQ